MPVILISIITKILILLIFFALLTTLVVLLKSLGINIPLFDRLINIHNYYTRIAKQRSESILFNAIDRANKIIADAEKKGIDIIDAEKQETKKLEDKYQKYLEKFSEELLQNLQKRHEEYMSTHQKDLDKQTEIFFQQIQEQTNEFLAKLHKSSQSQISGDITKIQNSLKEYEHFRKELLDNEIISMIEKIVAKTFNKSISLKQHTELVYESLEQAKKDKIFT